MTREQIRIRRILSVSVLGGLIVVAAAASISTAAWLDTALDDARARNARYDRLAAEGPALQADLARLRARRVDGPPALLPGTTAVQAAARLQDHVKRIVSAADGRVQSLEVLPPGTAGDLETVSLRLSATIPHSRLRDVLFDLESKRPAVILDRLAIRPGSQHRRMSTDPANPLDLTVTLRAFRADTGPGEAGS